jgi:hypothetical protein
MKAKGEKLKAKSIFFSILLLAFSIPGWSQVWLGNMRVTKGFNEVFPDRTVIHQPWGAVGTVWIGQVGYIIPEKANPRLSPEAGEYWRERFRSELQSGMTLEYFIDGGNFYGMMNAGDSLQVQTNTDSLVELLKKVPFGEIQALPSEEIIYKLPRE